MKRSVLVLVALVLAFLLPRAEPAIARYNIIQLHSGVLSDDSIPTITNRGWVAFFHQGCQLTTGDPPSTYTETGKYQLYRNGILDTLNIPPNISNPYPNYYSNPPSLLINTHGQLGYRIQDYSDEEKYKIYFHDGPGGDPRLLSSTANWPGNVQLNEAGQMAWTGNDDALDLQVYFFSNGTTTPITTYRSPSSMADNVSLNDNGQLVWIDITQEGSEYRSNIRHYEKSVITGLYSTTRYFFGSQIQINNLGQIVWAESNGSTIDVMLYDGGNVHALPGGEGFSQLTSLQINHQGQIMWLGLKAGTEYDIYLYSNGVTRKITNYEDYAPGTVDIWQNSPTDVKTKFSPRMNNKGDIVWVTRVANPADAYDWDMAVYVYHRGRITKLDGWKVVPNSFTAWSYQFSLGASWAQINDVGQVVWSRYSGPLVPDLSGRFQLYLATPVRPISYLHLLLTD